MSTQPPWLFFGYVTPNGRPDVQEWYDALLDVERNEITDVLGYLQNLPRHLWKKPEFDVFDPDLSEIRIRVSALNRIYRLYGTFWPKDRQTSYTVLIAKNKKVDNDKRGKREATDRLKNLRKGEARVEPIKF